MKPSQNILFQWLFSDVRGGFDKLNHRKLHTVAHSAQALHLIPLKYVEEYNIKKKVCQYKPIYNIGLIRFSNTTLSNSESSKSCDNLFFKVTG